MKFGKEFSSQMVPEWQHGDAYMDYDSLKNDLKLKDDVNALTRVRPKNDHEGGRQMTARTGRIQVKTTAVGGWETTFLDEEGREYEVEFFRRLDDEFNKVSKFYKEKVEEVREKKKDLTERMNALFKSSSSGREEEMNLLASGTTSSTENMSPTPAGVKSMDVESQAHREIVEEGESSRVGQLNEEVGEAEDNGAMESSDEIDSSFWMKLKSSVKNRKPNNKLKRDYIDFYRKLQNLKTYSLSNVKAFSKILKKYGKKTKCDARKTYMEYVNASDIRRSVDVGQLIESVEKDFIEHFANSNRTKGMKMLRPKVIRERHRLTFSTGFSAGCVFSLIVALVAIIRTRNTLQNEGQDVYMNTMFPLYSWFGFVMLHIIMYAVNLYYWRRYRVNYSKIFVFKQGTELGERQILLVAFSIGVFALICVLANLDMEVDPRTKQYKLYTELLPLFLLVALLVVLVLPFNLFYRSNRFWYLTCLLHCLAAPLYKVSFADSFLGDQFTSQVQALRSFEFYICYYGWGDFKHRKNTCEDSRVYKAFFFIVAVIPYLSRLLQCLRRRFDSEKNREQEWNGVKYLLTIVAVCFRTAYSIQPGQIVWRRLAIITSVVAAIFGTFWDFVHDWGLLNRTSDTPWLRDKLLIPQKKVYFIAMILNVLLRFAWIQTVLDFKLPFRHSQPTMVAVVASLEIIRRGIWNFFRLENEHLKNVKNESSINGGDKCQQTSSDEAAGFGSESVETQKYQHHEAQVRIKHNTASTPCTEMVWMNETAKSV